MKRSDEEIAAAVVGRLSWDVSVPADAIKARVEGGWVTLSGEVEWHYQKMAAQQDVGHLLGVVGVSNQVTIRPRVNVANLCDNITHALRRSWFFNPDNIFVSADAGRIHLTGTVDSWHDRQIAASTAWAAPGATSVVNDLSII